MSMSAIEWMNGDWNGKHYYSPAEWMRGDWNGDFFYELSKLGEVGCLKFCMYLGLVSKKYECPKCGKNMKFAKKKGWLRFCRKSGTNPHYLQRSYRRGTFFQKSHLSIGLILRFTYMWLSKIPQESITNDLGIASHTLTDWTHFCREVCIDYCLRLDGLIGGNEYIVDIYEASLSEPKHKIKRHAKGHYVFVGLVRYLNDCFVEVVEDNSAEVLVEIIIKRVVPGSIIVIECSSLYGSSRSVFKQLEVVHNVTIKNTYKSDGIWYVVKRAILDSREGEFNGEVAEYIWRRQNNYVVTQKVRNFFKAVSESFPPNTKD